MKKGIAQTFCHNCPMKCRSNGQPYGSGNGNHQPRAILCRIGKHKSVKFQQSIGWFQNLRM